MQDTLDTSPTNKATPACTSGETDPDYAAKSNDETKPSATVTLGGDLHRPIVDGNGSRGTGEDVAAVGVGYQEGGGCNDERPLVSTGPGV